MMEQYAGFRIHVESARKGRLGLTFQLKTVLARPLNVMHRRQTEEHGGKYSPKGVVGLAFKNHFRFANHFQGTVASLRIAKLL